MPSGGGHVQGGGQRVALDEFEDEETGAVVFFQPVDGPDVGVVERPQQFGLN